MIQLLDDDELHVKEVVAWSLGKLKAKAAIPSLLRMLTTEIYDLRLAIIEALGEIADTAAVPHLLKILRGIIVQDTRTAAIVMIALGKIGDPSAIPELRQRLSDTRTVRLSDSTGGLWQSKICTVAALALEQIGTAEALRAVEQWRRDQGGQQA